VVFDDGEEYLPLDLGRDSDKWTHNSVATSSIKRQNHLKDTLVSQDNLKTEESKKQDLPQGPQIRFKIERAELLNMKAKLETHGDIVEKDDP
jgi:hypothetical protein